MQQSELHMNFFGSAAAGEGFLICGDGLARFAGLMQRTREFQPMVRVARFEQGQFAMRGDGGFQIVGVHGGADRLPQFVPAVGEEGIPEPHHVGAGRFGIISHDCACREFSTIPHAGRERLPRRERILHNCG